MKLIKQTITAIIIVFVNYHSSKQSKSKELKTSIFTSAAMLLWDFKNELLDFTLFLLLIMKFLFLQKKMKRIKKKNALFRMFEHF